ncbi:glycosyltransferase, partial [Pseudonocardia sp. McavD-2-B]|nr:glycosyltransferase [Pseudonocardia sp. McavD-2-B]
MTGPVTTVVLAKAPVPGRVKTRLCPPATPELAAAIASAALLDTLDAAAGVAGDTVVALTGDRAAAVGAADLAAALD